MLSKGKETMWSEKIVSLSEIVTQDLTYRNGKAKYQRYQFLPWSGKRIS